MEVVHERNLPFHGQLHRLIGSAQPICHTTRSLAALHGEPRSLHYYSERIPAMSERNMCLENTAEKALKSLQCLYVNTITINLKREWQTVSRSYRGRMSSLQNQCPSSSAKVKNKWRYTSIASVCIYDVDMDSLLSVVSPQKANSVIAVNGVRKLPRLNTRVGYHAQYV